mgnify:CR=1 FL=1|jgi:hypothetical protein
MVAQIYSGIDRGRAKGLSGFRSSLSALYNTETSLHCLLMLFAHNDRPIFQKDLCCISGTGHDPVAVYTARLNQDGPVKARSICYSDHRQYAPIDDFDFL